MNGQSITIYGDSSAADTAGGNDSLSIGGLTSGTVYGAAGGDTLILEEDRSLTSIWVLVRTSPPGSSSYQSSTLLGGSGADVFTSTASHLVM